MNRAGCAACFTTREAEPPSSTVFCPSMTSLAGFELSRRISSLRLLLIRWGRDESRYGSERNKEETLYPGIDNRALRHSWHMRSNR